MVRNNKPGVYFLSIEGGKHWSCKIAKYMSGLPYRHSNIKRENGKYISNNPQYNDRLNIEFKIKNKLTEKTNLDKWLTERYALFQDNSGSIDFFEIHHLEWEINKIEIEKLELKYERFEKLFSGKPNIYCTTLGFVHLPPPAPCPKRGEPALDAQNLKWRSIAHYSKGVKVIAWGD